MHLGTVGWICVNFISNLRATHTKWGWETMYRVINTNFYRIFREHVKHYESFNQIEKNLFCTLSCVVCHVDLLKLRHILVVLRVCSLFFILFFLRFLCDFRKHLSTFTSITNNKHLHSQLYEKDACSVNQNLKKKV